MELGYQTLETIAKTCDDGRIAVVLMGLPDADIDMIKKLVDATWNNMLVNIHSLLSEAQGKPLPRA